MTTQTELQKQIAELKAEVARFQGFAEATNHGFGTTEFTGVLTYANPALARILEADSPEEIVGKDFFSLAPEEEAKELESAILQTVMKKGQWMGERPILSLKGKPITTEQNIFLIYDEQGAPAYVANIIADITELRQTEEALRESEERYRAFSDATTEGILLHKEGTTIDVNQSFLDMYGYDDPSELIGKNAIELTIATSEDREKIYQNVRSGGTGPYEVMAKRADGTTFPIEINARQIHYRGKLVRVVLITDLTRRKQAEAERERLQQEAIDAQKRAIQELSTPIIPVMERIIVMPLIGSIDTLRARNVTRALLAGIREHRAKVVILDITGVSMVDSGVAAYLNNTIQAARLKGARTIVTGISDAVAETIVDLGIDWRGIETLSDLQTGLVVALNSLGIELVKGQ
jgi:rsbT co-antagonist protein RsbR